MGSRAVTKEWGDGTEEEFFLQMLECRDAYRRLGNAIHHVLGRHTAIEFGAGVGSQTQRLYELGWAIFGYERSGVARRLSGFELLPCDLSVPMSVPQAEVCICTETAEHIPAEFGQMVVKNVANAATKFIVWSAAPPGQEWPGHVNLKPAGYWLGLFAIEGWVPDHIRTTMLRDTMIRTHAQHEYCADNFWVLVCQ